MVRKIVAVYENGVFRPTEPVTGLDEHAAVQLTVEKTANVNPQQRVFGLQRGKVEFVSPDFDEELGDEFWLGEKH
jgi:predicted DNA-binding antitoxin AbrB/MazE fold protein